MSAMAHGLLGGSTARTTWGFRSLSKRVQACRLVTATFITFTSLQHGDLFDSTTAKWKSSLIWTHFTAESARAILSTHIPQTPIKDTFVWRLSPTGELTTKSACRFLTRDNTLHCARIHTSGVWKFLCALQIPPKWKIFIWRLIWNALPLKVNLNTRGIGVDRTCNLCSNHEEMDAHLFRDCPFTATCWFDGQLGLRVELAKATTLRQWANKVNCPSTTMSTPCKISFVHHLTPPPHSPFLIVDGAWKLHKTGKNSAGIGWVLTSTSPHTLKGNVAIYALTPLQAEAQALLSGIQEIIQQEIRDVRVFTDCAALGTIITRSQPGPPEVVSLLQSIRHEISFFTAFQLLAGPRSIVSKAHFIAIAARKRPFSS
ncbi:hypothetical protein RDABS01_010447 [Bienertia sinuspersici]